LPGCDLFRSADERVARAEQQMAAQDYPAAMIELKNALQDEPNNFRARTRLAEVEFRLGDVISAEKDLRRAFELGTPAPQDAELMARIQLALGRGRQLLAQLDAHELQLTDSAEPYYRGQALLCSSSMPRWRRSSRLARRTRAPARRRSVPPKRSPVRARATWRWSASMQ